MRRRAIRKHLKAGITLLILMVVLMVATGTPKAGFAQDDCTEECWEGDWDSDLWFCFAGPPHDCAGCTVVCPGGGGSPPKKQQRTA